MTTPTRPSARCRALVLESGGQSAYATSRHSVKAKMRERDIDSEELATYLLSKGSDGGWKIPHSHTSSRPVRRSAAH